jgi:ABC-type glycerol-3-phosphate transport system substrate-binding protein
MKQAITGKLNRRRLIGAGLALGAAGIAACAPGAAPTAAPAAKPTTAPAAAAEPTKPAAPVAAPVTKAGGATIRVLTADFFYEPMILPATAVFNDAQQGKVFVKAEKAPEGWDTKVRQQVRDKQVIWNSYAVDSFFNLYQRIKTGMVQPLDDYIKSSSVPYAKDFKDKYFSPNIYESGVFDGKFYIMPTKLNMAIVPYNVQMVQGVGYEKPPETWDEMRAMLHKIKEKYSKDDVLACSINADLWRAVGGIYCSLTDTPYTKEGMVDLDSKEWLDAMDLMKGLFTDKLAEPKLFNSPDEITTWQKGKIAVVWNYPSWLLLGQQAWGRNNYTAVNMTKKSKGDKNRTWMHVDGTYMFANVEHPQETVDWMLSLLGPEGEASDTFARGTITRSGSPMYKSHIEGKIVKDNPEVPWLYNTYQMAPASTTAPLSPLHFLVDAKGKKFLPAYFRGEADAKSTIAKIKEEVNAEKDKMLAASG